MQLIDSVRAAASQLQNECEGMEDAENYMEDAVSDVLDEHPRADQAEVEAMLREELSRLFGRD